MGAVIAGMAIGLAMQSVRFVAALAILMIVGSSDRMLAIHHCGHSIANHDLKLIVRSLGGFK
jgi:hypothetical protein